MSHQFTSGGSGPGTNGYNPPASFPGFPSNFSPPLNGLAQNGAQTQPQQAFAQLPHHSAHPMSSGNPDVERLERLKKEILEGQNPLYKAIPNPIFLESLYLGRTAQGQTSVPPHPDQVPSSAKAVNTSHQNGTNGQSNGGTRANEGSQSAQAPVTTVGANSQSGDNVCTLLVFLTRQLTFRLSS